MKKCILLFCFIVCFCNRGPAEDRGEINCRNDELFYLWTLRAFPDDQQMHLLAAISIPSQCYDKYNYDSLINRYYRGYVLGKE